MDGTRNQLQEVPFACFEQENDDFLHHETSSGSYELPGVLKNGIRTHDIALPAGVQLTNKNFRVRLVECVGAGTFYYKREELQDRFLSWRISKSVVVIRESSLHESLEQNAIRLQFAAPVVPNGVFAVESWNTGTVMICVMTHAGSIHRFNYQIPQPFKQSMASNSSKRSIFTPDAGTFALQPANSMSSDALASLEADESVTNVLWINEYNAVVATDAGRVIGLNFGLPSRVSELQEFVFSDESMVQWLWNGLLRTSARDEVQRLANTIVSMTCLPRLPLGLKNQNVVNMDEDVEEDDDDEDDICILTLSADMMLRAWSFARQSCIGKQQLRTLTATESKPTDPNELVLSAKILALPPTRSDNCRLLLHMDTSVQYAGAKIFLLRGDVPIGNKRRDLVLHMARIFTIASTDMDDTMKNAKRIKLVDFAVDKNVLYSAWRSTSQDFVVSHANPMALTGPRIIPGQLVYSLNAQMKQYQDQDDQGSFDAHDENVLATIDSFFTERILLPGRFSRQNLYRALMEYHGGIDLPLRPLFDDASTSGLHHSHDGPSKYKDLLLRMVADKWLQTIGGVHARQVQDPSMLRIGIWKSILDLCMKHWRVESVPIGFVAVDQTTSVDTIVPGSPVLLRRNRISLLFPSTSFITKSFASSLDSISADAASEIANEVLPVFDAFSSRSLEASVTSDLLNNEQKVESLVDAARHVVRLGMNVQMVVQDNGSVTTPDLVLMRAVLRLSKLFVGGSDAQKQILSGLLTQLFPFDGVKEEAQAQTDQDHDMDDEDEEDRRLRVFGGREISFAFRQAAVQTMNQIVVDARRLVLLLSYLIETRPDFIEVNELQQIELVYLPRAIITYRRWACCKYLAMQNATTTSELDAAAAKSSASLMPPLLQLFLMENNESITKSPVVERMVVAFDSNRHRGNTGADTAQQLLAVFTREILQSLSQLKAPWIAFLQERKEFRILRALLRCNLNEVQMQPHSERVETTHVQFIAACLLQEGHHAVSKMTGRSISKSHSDQLSQHARWCFERAMQCFGTAIDLTDVRYIHEVVELLKEHVPRGFFDLSLQFLWSIIARLPSSDETNELKQLLWINVFKYSVEERLFRDAHIALMRLCELSSKSSDSSASECASYLVKELCRYGQSELICELQWGPLEADVEQQIQWQAANANILSDEHHRLVLNPQVVMYYQLLYTFYIRKAQPANAATAMHALYLRLKLAHAKHGAALKTQRNALYSARSALLLMDKENRWFVRKYHNEERLLAGATGNKTSELPLSIVTITDIEREIAVLDGKLWLLQLGHEENMLLSSMDANDVVALLVDATQCCGEWTGTKAERKQENLMAIELATDITRKHKLSFDRMTKSMARYCVATIHTDGLECLCWELLASFLTQLNSLVQYQVAAATILDWKRKIVLPSWLYEPLTDPATGNPAMLLQLFLEHGLLIEAIQLSLQLIPTQFVEESKVAFQKRANAIDPSLPWLPYNLLDATIDMADAALQQAKGSTVGTARLRSGLEQLRTKLTAYFKYVDTLEQARAVNSSSSAMLMG